LPLYPALWFLAARPTRGIWALVAALLAAPFLWHVWWAPRAFPVAEDGYYHHTTELARGSLPYETTQSHIPGGRDVAQNGLWLKFLSPEVGPGQGGLLLKGRAGSLLAGSAEVLAGVQIPDGSTEIFVRFGDPRAVHPMWWTDRPFHLYALTLELERPPPTPLRLTIRSAPAEVLGLGGG